jgi:NAD(P)-dependent dehydrogenase (short-subunit alcohol dehydrogenase family)
MDALTSLFSLAGRTALVTGGTRGIGAQMAIALAEAGADIILLQVRCIDIYVPILQANQKKRERDLYGIHSHFARKTSQ